MSNMEQRINFLNRVSSIQKPTNPTMGLQDLETMRFFNESPTKIRLQKARQSHRSVEPNNNHGSPPNSPGLGSAKEPREPLDQLIKAYTKVSKKYKEQSVHMLDIRGVQKLEEFHFNDEHIFPSGTSTKENKLSPRLYKDSSPLSNRRSRKTSTNVSSSPLLPGYRSSYRNERDSPISTSKAPSMQDSGVFMSIGGSDFKLKSLGPEDFKKRLSNRKSSVGANGVIVPQLMLNKHSSVGNLEDEGTPANSTMRPKGLYTPSVKNMGFLSPSSEVSSAFTLKSPVSKKAINLKIGNNRGVIEVSDWRKRVFQRTLRGGDSGRARVGSTSISPKKYH